MTSWTVTLTLPDCGEWEDSTPLDAVESFLNFAQGSPRLYVYVVENNDTGERHRVDLANLPSTEGPAQATHVLHYTSADGPGPDATWSVYRERYIHKDAAEPVDGSQEHVSTHPNEQAADAEAERLQGLAN